MRLLGIIRKLATVALPLAKATCGDGESTDTTTAAGGETTTTGRRTGDDHCSGEAVESTVMLRVDFPKTSVFRVADSNDYVAEEGLEVTRRFFGRSGAAIQQFRSGTVQIASVETGTVAAANEEGLNNVRAIGNTNRQVRFLIDDVEAACNY